jgi:hypothetical protein
MEHDSERVEQRFVSFRGFQAVSVVSPLPGRPLLASALAANPCSHAVRIFAHGPHSLGLAPDADETAI